MGGGCAHLAQVAIARNWDPASGVPLQAWLPWCPHGHYFQGVSRFPEARGSSPFPLRFFTVLLRYNLHVIILDDYKVYNAVTFHTCKQ